MSGCCSFRRHGHPHRHCVRVMKHLYAECPLVAAVVVVVAVRAVTVVGVSVFVVALGGIGLLLSLLLLFRLLRSRSGHPVETRLAGGLNMRTAVTFEEQASAERFLVPFAFVCGYEPFWTTFLNHIILIEQMLASYAQAANEILNVRKA